MMELLRDALQTLWEEGEFILSRGRRAGGRSPLLVLAPAVDQPAPGSLQRLAHEYALRDALEPAWAARPLALVQHQGRPTLVRADPGGELLARLLGTPWELAPFLRVAIGLAVALGRLHARGFIHKDVKPAHILAHAVTGEAWLTGFGIASRLPRERPAPAPPDVMAGTLAYMAHDVSDRLLLPEKLYGREREIDRLLAAFDRVVARGTPELVLVSGAAGIGKSAVVHELHRALVPPRGLFASGKFDQYKRDIPYATLAHAFQSLVRPLLGRNEAELGTWRDALRQALGPHGQLIVQLIPELALVIGTQPPVPDLPPPDAQHRFQTVFRRFLSVFARPEHPLVLFLDDLQWLDAATLDLLQHVLTESEVRHLLVVGAYRDNEVSPSHPLMRTLAAIRTAAARVPDIVLAPLTFDDVGQLVADTLHCVRDRARPLAQLVHEKTAGNPFFALQFVTALAEEGLLAFDPDAAAWTWDLARIQATGYTDNVVDLLVGTLHRLPATTREAVHLLACLGHRAETATLQLVHGASEEAIHATLWEAVRAGLARGGRRAQPHRGHARQGVDGLCLGAHLSRHGRGAPGRGRVGAVLRAPLRARAPPGRV